MALARSATGPARSPARGPTALCLLAMTACLRFGTLLLVGSALSFGASRDQLDRTFANDIQPLLATYCTRCHGPQLQTAEIDFSIFDDHGSVVRSRASVAACPARAA